VQKLTEIWKIKVFFLSEKRALTISVLLNLVIHTIAAIVYFNPVDFVLQVETARQIAQGRILYYNIEQITFHDSILPNPQYPPLYLYSLAILIFVVGTEAFTFFMAKLFLTLVNFAVGFLLYYLIRQNYEKGLALFAFNWFLLNPATLGIVLGGYHENFMLLFVFVGYFFFFKSRSIISGTFMGLSLLVKPTAGIYMIPILIWGLKKKDYSTIQIWISAFFTFLLVSLPFLIRSPESYITDVFLIHSSRLDPSMSLYTYILTDLSPTVVPFVIQLVVFIAIGIFLYNSSDFKEREAIIPLNLPFVSAFLAFNRILYPHYIPFLFPFLTWFLIQLISNYSQRINPDQTKNATIGILLGLGVVYLGYSWWSILWTMERYQTYLINPFFLISAAICIIGLLILTIVSLWGIKILDSKRFEVKTNV
jgi:uncharacterized membrane protein